MTLPDPQFLANTQAFSVFAQLMAQATAKLLGSPDVSEADYEMHKEYFRKNLPKLKVVIEHLEGDLG